MKQNISFGCTNNMNLSLAHKAGMSNVAMGMAIGGAVGFATSYATAKQQGLDPWNNEITKWPSNDGIKGHYETEILQSRDRFTRYRRESGTYVSPEGTPFGKRSLPSFRSNDVFNTYEVLKPFPVFRGKISPYFLQSGGGIQYKLPYSVDWLLRNHYLLRL